MISALDTNVLLDVLIPGAKHAKASKRLLDDAVSQGALVLSDVVYAELAAQFRSREDLDGFISDTGLRLVASSRAALYRASEAWLSYLQSRDPRTLRCVRCGGAQPVSCPSCGADMRVRQHILTDFLIGGHALVHADRLLTRDRGFYRGYFADLSIVS